MARVAIIGGGWAGLASAHALFRAGHQPTIFETGRQLGGRARSLPDAISQREGFSVPLENGQHLLLGAYQYLARWLAERDLALDDHFLRTPLTWHIAPEHLLFHTPSGVAAPWHGLLALLRAKGWRWSTRLRVLNGLRQFKQWNWHCPAEWTWQHCLDELKQDTSSRNTWWYPLCLAIANTEPAHTQAQGLLTVLQTIFEGPAHYSDFWFPKQSLSELADALVHPAIERRLRHTVREVSKHPQGFLVDGHLFDALVLAAPPPMSGRLLTQLGLLEETESSWSAMPFHSITTCYLKLAAPYRLPSPMVGLLPDPIHPAGSCELPVGFVPTVRERGKNHVVGSAAEETGALMAGSRAELAPTAEGDSLVEGSRVQPAPTKAVEGLNGDVWAETGSTEGMEGLVEGTRGNEPSSRTPSTTYPAWGQWVFDRGQIAGQNLEQAELAVVISQAHTLHGFDAQVLAHACWQQLSHCFGPQLPALQHHFVITDKRATFALTPELERPSVRTANPRVVLAGDWVAGPYPATLEGAVRSGFEASQQLLLSL